MVSHFVTLDESGPGFELHPLDPPATFAYLKELNGAVNPAILGRISEGRLVVGDAITTASYWSGGGTGGGTYIVTASGTGLDDGGSYINAGSVQLQAVFGGTVDVTQFGAKGDGVTDDTAAFTNAIATATGRSLPLVISGGVFVLSGTGFFIEDNITIAGQGPASTVVKWTTDETTCFGLRGDQVHVSGIRVQGNGNANAGSSGKAAIAFAASSRGTISDVEVDGVTTSGVVLHGVEQATVTNLNCRNIGEHGLYITGNVSINEKGHNIAVSGLNVDTCGFSALKIAEVEDVNVAGVTCYESGVLVDRGVDRVTLSSVTVKGAAYGARFTEDSRQCTLNGFSFEGQTNVGLRVEGTASEVSASNGHIKNTANQNARVSSNTSIDNVSMDGWGGGVTAVLAENANVRVTNCHFPGGAGSIRYQASTTGGLVEGNTGVSTYTDLGTGNRFSTPQARGTAAPTTGTWVRGDIVWNTSPNASSTVGWVCVTAGTPGTWKTFGAIAA